MDGVVESTTQSPAFLSYCYMMIFVGKSTRYLDVDPWFISTTGFLFPDTYRKAARKPCDVYVWSTSIISSGLL